MVTMASADRRQSVKTCTRTGVGVLVVLPFPNWP